MMPRVSTTTDLASNRVFRALTAVGCALAIVTVAGCGGAENSAVVDPLATEAPQAQEVTPEETMGSPDVTGGLARENATPGATGGPPSGASTGESTNDPTQSADNSARATGEDEPTLQERPAAESTEEEILADYPDDPEPAEEVAATLCNLTQDHLAMMNEQVSSPAGVDEQNLRLALISLGDRLETWEGIAWHFPESQDDIETAQAIYSHWEYSLALLDTGDVEAADEQLDLGASLIETLPDDATAQVGCDT